MNSKDKWYNRGYLPHFDDEGRPQTITFRLADSLPVSVFKRIAALARNADERAILTDKYLDEGRGSCILEREPIAKIVRDSILYNDGRLYDLKDWVIMPNHGHVSYLNGDRRPTQIAGKIKGYTSWKIGEQFPALKGQIWQEGTFDRYIRDAHHNFVVRHYFWFNPVRAGLVEDPWDWPWSSIHDTKFDEEELRTWFAKHRDAFWDCWM